LPGAPPGKRWREAPIRRRAIPLRFAPRPETQLSDEFGVSPGLLTAPRDRQDGIDVEACLQMLREGILDDQGFVEREDREPGFGLVRGIDGHVSWAAVPLRLTARGHQFIEALRNQEVWATLKRDFKDASINTLWDVAKKLLEGYTRSKIEGLLKGHISA